MKVVGFIPVCEESNFKRNRFTSTCGIHVYFLDFPYFFLHTLLISLRTSLYVMSFVILPFLLPSSCASFIMELLFNCHISELSLWLSTKP